MDKMRLGRTGLMVSRSGFGSIPIQRISRDDARKLLLKAYENGINFFDTARGYSDSEEKIGYALSELRKNIIIATKTPAADRKAFFQNLETSLRNLKTDYIDIYQLHNPKDFIDRGHELYEAMLEAKEKGMIRFIGFTNHRVETAEKAVLSGLYDTLQFPFNYLSSESELNLADMCREKDVGFIAMKALSGGLITTAATTFTFIRQYGNVVPIWGMQKENELDEFIALEKNPPKLEGELLKQIEKDRKDLAGSFCRGCGYCTPCPVGIPIPVAARISLLVERTPYQQYLSDEFKGKMELINQCLDCGNCKSRCPYELDTPGLLRKMLKNYEEFYSLHK